MDGEKCPAFPDIAWHCVAIWCFLPWLLVHGPDLPLFFNQALANPISIFAWLDVMISAVTLLIFIVVDGRQHQIRYRGLAVIGTLTIGVSCGLPLYLYLRARQHL
ncbi:DUF2834 domain-containing protein [Photobacterium galatheae]|uniref:DUF2834 domain-containing protein n=1 Tax=Photobacterium galatheae TaxID=1654360 RepID=UPI0026A888D4